MEAACAGGPDAPPAVWRLWHREQPRLQKRIHRDHRQERRTETGWVHLRFRCDLRRSQRFASLSADRLKCSVPLLENLLAWLYSHSMPFSWNIDGRRTLFCNKHMYVLQPAVSGCVLRLQIFDSAPKIKAGRLWWYKYCAEGCWIYLSPKAFIVFCLLLLM